MTAQHMKRWEALVLVAILCVAAGLRLYRIQDEPVWYDEVVSTVAFDQPTLGTFFEKFRSNDPTAVPFYFTLEYAFVRCTGGGVLAARILSVFLSLATIALLYSLGRYLFGGTAGLVAAALLTLSRTHIYFSQEIRMYALLLPLALLSMLTFIAALNSNRRALWAINVLVNACIVWTHLFGCLLLLTEGLFMLFFSGPRAFRRTFLWTLAHLPLFAPLALWLSASRLRHMEVATSWISMPSWNALFEHYFYYCSGSGWVFGFTDCLAPHMPFLPSHALPGLFMFAASVWLVVWTFRHRVRTTFLRNASGAWSLKLRSRFAIPRNLRHLPGYKPRSIFFLFVVFLLPPLVLFAISFAVRPYFVGRYVFYPCFPFCVLAGAGAAVMPRGWVRIAAVTLLLGSLALLLPDLRRPLRLDLSTASRIISEYGHHGDFVFVMDNTQKAQLAVEGIVTGAKTRCGETYLEDALVAVESGYDTWVIMSTNTSLAVADFDEVLKRREYEYDHYQIPGRVPVALFRIIPYQD